MKKSSIKSAVGIGGYVFFRVYSTGLNATECDGYLKHDQNVHTATKIIVVCFVLMVEWMHLLQIHLGLKGQWCLG